MPSGFATLARGFLQPAYALHAQAFVWTPMKEAADVNASAVADSARPGGTIQGAFFDVAARQQGVHVYDVRTDQRPGFVSNVPRIEFGPPAGGAPPDVRRLDILADENGEVWKVVSTYIKKTGVLVAEVNAIG